MPGAAHLVVEEGDRDLDMDARARLLRHLRTWWDVHRYRLAPQVEAVIARAQSAIGTPYVWGGGDANGPTTGVNGGSVSGFDCSGLVLYAFAAAGVALPHYTGYQYQRGTQVPASEAKRGDLLFWGPNGSQHVAIYLGDGTMIEAPQSGQNVTIAPVRWSGMAPNAVRLL